MENIYKIKIRSNPDPRDVYPSERRYSSSIVLGLSIMFLALATTSSLMGTLVIRRLTSNQTVPVNASEDERLLAKIEEDLALQRPESHPLNLPPLVSAAAFVMALGQFMAGFAGILAWKRWYIDNNITWFFLSSCFSSVTASISLLIIGLALLDSRESYLEHTPQISVGLTANIFITSLLGVVWAIVATNVAFRGMKNNYPDDMVLTKGRVEVSTVNKGNKKAKIVPPDILNHFPKSGKFAKFFPKKESGGLPKAESNKEYEERVKKFLSGHSDAYSNDKI